MQILQNFHLMLIEQRFLFLVIDCQLLVLLSMSRKEVEVSFFLVAFAYMKMCLELLDG